MHSSSSGSKGFLGQVVLGTQRSTEKKGTYELDLHQNGGHRLLGIVELFNVKYAIGKQRKNPVVGICQEQCCW